MACINPKKRDYSTMASDCNPQNNNENNNDKPMSCSLGCSACHVTFVTKGQFDQHLQTKVHRKNMVIWDLKCGIFVRGFNPTTSESDLKEYFSQYGTVKFTKFNSKKGYLILNFIHPACVKEVLSKCHYLGGRKLLINRKEPQLSMHPNLSFDFDEDEQSELMAALKNVDGAHALDVLQRALQPMWHTMLPRYDAVCRDLHAILSPHFPSVEIHPFGSTVTGLYFKNSDIDIYISNIKLATRNDVKILRQINRILNGAFTNSVVIPAAKIPILKCIHRFTRIKCDLNVKNILGVCNSELIRYYLRLFPSVKSCMLVLKYWGKVHKLAGQNPILSNYALAMMFISFLQDKFNFPSVFSMQAQSHIKNYSIFNGQEFWNGTFDHNYRFVPRLFPTAVAELLGMFFQYYIEFNYKEYIICPYLGAPLKKCDFQVPDDRFYLYRHYIASPENVPFKNDSFICIQDPFEHCLNISKCTNKATLDRFVSFCRLGANISSQNHQVLYRLFSEVPPVPAPNSMQATKKRKGNSRLCETQNLSPIKNTISTNPGLVSSGQDSSVPPDMEGECSKTLKNSGVNAEVTSLKSSTSTETITIKEESPDSSLSNKKEISDPVMNQECLESLETEAMTIREKSSSERTPEFISKKRRLNPSKISEINEDNSSCLESSKIISIEQDSTETITI